MEEKGKRELQRVHAAIEGNSRENHKEGSDVYPFELNCIENNWLAIVDTLPSI